MPNADYTSRGSSVPREADIDSARAQIEALRRRQKRLPPSGRLTLTPIHGGLPNKPLPGYSLLRELHRGGQGIVYLATQESTGRQVAIKVVNLAVGAESTAARLARFEREIDVLSRLKHPNIVTVHDCGRDAEHVYLVMDYIIGRPLDALSDAPRPQIRERLALFAKICDGVNAAHLRGMIHRDLKPRNILVDERNEPHVLDFGLVKLTGDSVATVSRAMTVTGQFVGSLPWASPEQAEGRIDELDIRTDVYSLGVVLYQLLTGRFPYPVTGSLAEVARHIAGSDPVRPSTLDREIDRELETIMLKALAKEPERRYQNAGELARDLRRYLSDEPIEARRDSLAYVMSKRLARYRVIAVAAAAILLATLAALAVSIGFWRQAEQQRIAAMESAAAARASTERADREARQAGAVDAFMRDVLSSVSPEQQGADVRLASVLRVASSTAAERFAGSPRQEAQVRETLAVIYDKLSLWLDARSELKRAHELMCASAGPDDPATLEIHRKYRGTLLNLSQAAEVERELDGLLPRLERLLGPDDPQTVAARCHVALMHLLRGRVDEAERMLRALRAHPAVGSDDAAQISILRGLINVATYRLSTADDAELPAILAHAETLAVEWIERSTRLNGPQAVTTLHAQAKWAEIICGLGRCEQAVRTTREILNGSTERLGACHVIRTSALYTLSEALARLGEPCEPAELQLQRLECVRGQVAQGSPMLLSSISDTLKFLERAGRSAEGEVLARELSAALRSLGGGHDSMLFATDLFVAHFVSDQQRLGEAEALFGPLLAVEARIDDDRTRARLHLYYGIHLLRRHALAEAEYQLRLAAAQLHDIRVGTWDVYPDDVIRAFIELYKAWGRHTEIEGYERLQAEVLALRQTDS